MDRNALSGGSLGASGGKRGAASAFDRLLQSRLGPTLLAVALGLVSSPLVAVAIAATSAPPYGPELGVEPPPVDFAHAMPIALVAVVSAGFVGGAIGGWFVRRKPLLGLLTAIAIAWPVAIVTLPVVPTLLGEQYATGYFCFDVCTAQIHSGELLSGLTAYGSSLLGWLVSSLLIALLVVACWLARRRDRMLLAAALGIAAVASINLFSLVERSGGAFTAFLCLVVGAAIWVAPYWRRRERTRPRAGTASGPAAPLARQDMVQDIQPLLCFGVQRDRLPRLHGNESDKVAGRLWVTESLAVHTPRSAH